MLGLFYMIIGNIQPNGSIIPNQTPSGERTRRQVQMHFHLPFLKSPNLSSELLFFHHIAIWLKSSLSSQE
jgi:hypothetical protein